MSRRFSTVASSDRITTGFTTHGTTRSYSIWAYATSNGEGNNGRMFDKRNTGADTEVEVMYLSGGSTTYNYFRTFSTTGGNWAVTQPSANAWHHVCVTYDSSSTANDPVMYIDGVSLSVTEQSTPSGSVVNNTASYVIGNRGGATTDRGWGGSLFGFCIWNVILTANEVLALARGIDPFKLRNASIPYYCRIEGILSPEPGWSGAGTQFSSTVQDTARNDNAPVRMASEYWSTPADITAGAPATLRQPKLALVGVGQF